MTTKVQKIFIIEKVFIVMSNITPKEKILVSILVKIYSKEQLEEELKDIVEYTYMSKLVRGAAKLIGINEYEISKIGLQYLNYAVDNYEKIKNKEYPEDIERVQQVYFYADESENVVMYNRKRVTINTLPKYVDQIEDHVFGNFYEYDPDTLDVDYGDSDLISFEPDKEMTTIVNISNNVLN
jgi:hypothetical protein